MKLKFDCRDQDNRLKMMTIKMIMMMTVMKLHYLRKPT